MKVETQSSILGCLLGTAVGDALGLPAEGMSRQRIARRWKVLQHHLIWNRGMFSDDTEHTLMVATTVLKHRDDPLAFQQALGWKLRWWLVALPAGVGLSTAKAILRLWLGFSASKAGVRSAGNGAAMRSAILGVVFCEDPSKRQDFVKASCRLTHTDPRAEESSILVAEAAALAARQASRKEVLETLQPYISSEEMRNHFAKLEIALAKESSVISYAEQIGCVNGVTGFAPNTVAVAVYAWLRHRGDFKMTISEVITCGGDTDTTAAIAGGICGAEVDKAGIPKEWINGLCDWPRSVTYIRQVAEAFTHSHPARPFLFWPAIPFRNLIFLTIVLLHGFRRLFPPY